MIDQLPAVKYQAVRPRANVSPLRSDIAGFIGRTRRGPLDQLVRVEGWREFEHLFGGADSNYPMTLALFGYFTNGGKLAHVHRASQCGQVPTLSGSWCIPKLNRDVSSDDIFTCCPARKGVTGTCFTPFSASSPGDWANELRVKLKPVFDGTVLRLEFLVTPKEEPSEQFTVRISDIEANNRIRVFEEIDELVRESSRYIVSQFSSLEDEVAKDVYEGLRRFDRRDIKELVFNHCTPIPANPNLEESMDRLVEEPEVAILVHCDPLDAIWNELETSLKKINLQKDRMVLTGPCIPKPTQDLRVVAAYQPQVKVEAPDSFESVTISPAGHVAGLMSRYDRDRGAHFTPANAFLQGVVDLEDSESQSETTGYINRIRCVPGQGIVVWGGRTLDPSPNGKFIAHQRFLHRLVRGVRRVAFPLVAETNGPELWRTITRAVTSLLLQAFQGGALQGARPEEAFFVSCNEKNNPYEDRVHGRVNCEIGVALAAPMEFITIRVTVSEGGELEVFDS